MFCTPVKVSAEDAIDNQTVSGGVMLDDSDEVSSDDSEDDLDFGLDDDIKVKEDRGEATSGGIVLDDDLVVEDEDVPERPFKGQSAVDAVKSVGEVPSMDDDDWGFGDILQGSQFQAD